MPISMPKSSDNSRLMAPTLRESLFVATCLILILTLNYLGMAAKTPTYDEPWHLKNGLRLLQGNAQRFHDSKMPVSALNALPITLLAEVPGQDSRLDNFVLELEGPPLRAARLVTTLGSLLLGSIVFLWSRRLYGPRSAALSLMVYTFSPNILAHSRLATTDLFASLAVTASLLTFQAFLNGGGTRRSFTAAATLGISQLAKYTCIFLYPLFIFLALLHHWGKTRERGRSFLADWDWRRLGGHAALFLFVSVLIIQAGFLFRGVGTPLSGYPLRSDFFQGILQRIGPLSDLPLPLPYPYLEGLDWVKHHEETGASYGPIYLWGERRRGEGFYSYFTVAVLFKVPIPLLILLGVGLIGFLRRPDPSWYRRELFLLLPSLLLFVYLSFFFKAQIGLRFLLPAFPLLFVFLGRTWESWGHLGKKLRWAPVILLTLLCASSLSIHPHYLSYFNGLTRDPTRAHRILVDSNLEWGQNGLFVRNYLESHPGARLDLGPDARISPVLRDFLEAHPASRLDPSRPTAGRILVDANQLAGIGLRDDYAWLRENFQPTGHVAHGWLIFDVEEEDLLGLGLK